MEETIRCADDGSWERGMYDLFLKNIFSAFSLYVIPLIINVQKTC